VTQEAATSHQPPGEQVTHQFVAGLQFHSEVSSKTKLFIIKNNKKE